MSRCPTKPAKSLAILTLVAVSANCGPVGPFEYVTRHTIAVKSYGRLVSRSDVQRWTVESYAIWRGLVPRWGYCIHTLIRHGLRVSVRFANTERVSCDTGDKQPVAIGCMHRDLSIVVADCGRDREIFIHEIGHLLSWVCDGDSQPGHELFRAVGFPYM